MPGSTLGRIRQYIQQGRYDMSAHAVEEMAEDDLDILDIEQAILTGRIARIEKDDPRGTKYVVQGLAIDQNVDVAVVGRFTATGRYLIVTVYCISEEE